MRRANCARKLGSAGPPVTCDGGGAATVSLPMPAYCMPCGAVCCAGLRNRRISIVTATSARTPNSSAVTTEPS